MIVINNADYTRFAVLPIKTQYARDESLNQGVLTLKNTSVELPFEPMSVVLYNGERWLVGSDNVTKTRFGKSNKYQHDIILIEETKLLEKYFVDNCTFTNSLLEKGTSIAGDVFPQTNSYKSRYGATNIPSYISNQYGIVSGYVSPLQSEMNFTFKKFTDIFDNYLGMYGQTCSLEVIKDGQTIFYNEVTENPQEYTTELSNGVYIARYSYGTSSLLEGFVPTFDVTYTFDVTAQGQTIREPYTITDVVNRLLYLSEIQRKGNYPRFTLNEKQSVKYSLVDAPEMSISNSTLREALNKVGDFIHCQVRLDNNIIYFDDYTTNNIVEITKKPVAESSSQEIEQFCTEIESNAQNLVPDEKDQSGSVVDPFLNGYITPRAETGTAEINDKTAFVPTKWNIHKLIKLEMGYLSDNTQIGDITDWVVEKTIYDAYSSFTYNVGIDSQSKANHIYWEQGKKGVRGLTFETENALHQVFENNAITNIINEKLGTSYLDSNISVPNMQFRITYIPVINARLKQIKPNIRAGAKRAINAYNQSAYKISSSQYGENMKGVVARLGNIEKVKTYIYKKGETLPQIANKIDEDYTISVIKKEEQNNFYKISLGLSKKFNRQNQFVGIDNEQRFYEISEKNAVERYVLYEDFAILSNTEIPLESSGKDQSIIAREIITNIKNRLDGLSSVYKEIYSARLELTDRVENKAGISKYINLPVISYNFGNSACFSFDFDDNYGAGNYIAGIAGSSDKLQNQLRYTDTTGEFEFMNINLYSDRYYNLPINYSRAVDVGDTLPKEWTLEGVSDNNYFPLVSTGSYPLRISKDNRENIHFSYQIHCLSNEDNVVIGSSLPKALCVAGWTAGATLKAYVLNRRIGAFENFINDITTSPISVHPSDATGYRNNKILAFPQITANSSGKSIAIVKSDDNGLVFGINMDIVSGQNIDLPDLYFRHKLYAD